MRGSFSGFIPLSEDGFAFVDAECLDTEGEVVRCRACGAEFPLQVLDADAAGEEASRPSATVWVCASYGGGGPRAAFYAARQALVEDLARQAGLEVVREYDGVDVDLGVRGDPAAVGAFLRTLAELGIGRLTVDVDAGAEAALREAVREAWRELEYELVVL